MSLYGWGPYINTWSTQPLKIVLKARVLWNTYPVHCCCMKLCETQLIAEEDYKFARTHTFALLTMVIALCTIKHLWIWTCWTNCTVFSMSIRKVQTYIQRARKRCDMDCISDLRVYSVWDVTWIALVISSDLCSVWQFHIFHIAMTGSSLLSSCSVFLPITKAWHPRDHVCTAGLEPLQSNHWSKILTHNTALSFVNLRTST